MKKTMKSFLKIGAVGFGGGSALIPVVEAEVVERQGYITPEDYTEHTILSNITPGALPIKLGMLTGYAIEGIPGMLAGAFGVALPGTLLTVLLLSYLGALGTGMIHQIELASVGISAFIIFLLVEYIHKVIKSAEREDFFRPAVLLMVVSVLVTCGRELRQLLTLLAGANPLWSGSPIFDISTTQLLVLGFFVIFFTGGRIRSMRMVLAAVLGVLYILLYGKAGFLGFSGNGMIQASLLALGIVMTVRDAWGTTTDVQRPNGRQLFRQVLAFGVVIAVCAIPAVLFVGDISRFLSDGTVSTITSFGGGEAYLTVADGIFVASGQLEASMLYGRILPIANAMPGPILVKILAGVGYTLGAAQGTPLQGYLLALLGLAVAVGSTCIMCLLVGGIYQMFSELAVFRVLRLWILPIICGLLVTTILSMLGEVAKVSAGAGVSAGGGMLLVAALFAGSWFFSRKCRMNDVVIIVLLGFAAVLMLHLCQMI